MNESDLLDELLKKINSDIEDTRNQVKKKSKDYLLYDLGGFVTLCTVKNYIRSLKEFGEIKPGEELKSDSDKGGSDKLVEYYQENKEDIDLLIEHSDKAHRLIAMTIKLHALEKLDDDFSFDKMKGELEEKYGDIE